MPKPPKPRFPTNAQVPSSKLSQLADLADYGATMPCCIATRLAAQSLVNNAPNGVIFDTEVFDNAAMFVGPSINVTVPDAGVYTVSGWCQITANTTGMRSLEIVQNGVVVLSAAGSAPSTFDARLALSNDFSAAAGDTFGLVAFQNSGIALNLTGARISVRRSSGT